MSMPYPEHTTYHRLYERFFQTERNEQLLAPAGNLEGKNVADLCGGGGRLSRAALARGARVTLVDESVPMTQAAPAGITVVYRDMVTWLQSFGMGPEFDAMFCQQAVNYWLSREVVSDLADRLKPGGVFVFNTFNRKPPEIPKVLQYEVDGVSFVEVSWLTKAGMVEHVQVREGEPPHTTRFKWISPEDYRAWLGSDFDLHEEVMGGSSVWTCTKKS